MKPIKKIDNSSFEQNKFVIYSFIVLIIIALTIRIFSSKESNIKTTINKSPQADSYIPNGFVLVPLELSNQENIKSVIEQFGFVDLFVGKPGQMGAKKLLRKVKILMTDKSLNSYMALVSEKTAEIILNNPGPYWAVIQNPNAEINKQKTISTNKIRIEYQKEIK